MTKKIENPLSDADDQRAKFKAALDAKNHSPVTLDRIPMRPAKQRRTLLAGQAANANFAAKAEVDHPRLGSEIFSHRHSMRFPRPGLHNDWFPSPANLANYWHE